MTHTLSFLPVIRLPLLLLALICAREVSFAALARFQGFPSRQMLIIEAVPIPREPVAKLPPPVAPGMDRTDSVAHPSDLSPASDLEKISTETKPVIAKPAEPDPIELQKAKIKAERERLNHNALLWQQERAANGSPSAIRSLGMRYLAGDGVEKDEPKGMDLLRKAAAGGDSAAQKELAKREPAKKE